jgi:aminomethyltransferase
MGFCLYGNDIDEETSPLEAGLGWITKFTDGNDFVDRKRLEQQKEVGVSKKLIGFILEERGIPRQHYEIRNEDDEPVGKVTSGTMSPMIKKGIGMGYVNTTYSEPGTPLFIRVRNKNIRASVVKPPFYKTV